MRETAKRSFRERHIPIYHKPGFVVDCGLADDDQVEKLGGVVEVWQRVGCYKAEAKQWC